MADHNRYWVDFEKGEFLGDFEGLYRDIDDPWHLAEAANPVYDALLAHLRKDESSVDILDVGCGKGAFSARLLRETAFRRIVGIDVAPTAIAKANARLGDGRDTTGRLSFAVGSYLDQAALRSVTAELGRDAIVLMSNNFWHLLHDLRAFTDSTTWLLRERLGPLSKMTVLQTFYPPGRQKYLTEVCTNPEQLAALFQRGGYRVETIASRLGENDAGYQAILDVRA